MHHVNVGWVTISLSYSYSSKEKKYLDLLPHSCDKLLMSNWPSQKNNAVRKGIENENYVQPATSGHQPTSDRRQKMTNVNLNQGVSRSRGNLSESPSTGPSKISRVSAVTPASPIPPPTVGPFKSPSPSSAGTPFRTASPMRASNQVPLVPVNTVKQFSKLDKTQQQVQEVTGVMRGNLDKVLERGDKLGDLDARAEQLELNANKFATTAKKLRSTMWWKSKKTCICIGLVCFVLFAAASLVAYFLLRPKAAVP